MGTTVIKTAEPLLAKILIFMMNRLLGKNVIHMAAKCAKSWFLVQQQNVPKAGYWFSSRVVSVLFNPCWRSTSQTGCKNQPAKLDVKMDILPLWSYSRKTVWKWPHHLPTHQQVKKKKKENTGINTTSPNMPHWYTTQLLLLLAPFWTCGCAVLHTFLYRNGCYICTYKYQSSAYSLLSCLCIQIWLDSTHTKELPETSTVKRFLKENKLKMIFECWKIWLKLDNLAESIKPKVKEIEDSILWKMDKKKKKKENMMTYFIWMFTGIPLLSLFFLWFVRIN